MFGLDEVPADPASRAAYCDQVEAAEPSYNYWPRLDRANRMKRELGPELGWPADVVQMEPLGVADGYLGHYDENLVPVVEKQIETAAAWGVDFFVYEYHFNCPSCTADADLLSNSLAPIDAFWGESMALMPLKARGLEKTTVEILDELLAAAASSSERNACPLVKLCATSASDGAGRARKVGFSSGRVCRVDVCRAPSASISAPARAPYLATDDSRRALMNERESGCPLQRSDVRQADERLSLEVVRVA